MKRKTARRFMARNKWKICSVRINPEGTPHTPPSWYKRWRRAKGALGDPRFFDFSGLKKRLLGF